MTKVTANQTITPSTFDKRVDATNKFKGEIAQTQTNKPTCQVDIYTETTTKVAPARTDIFDKNKKQMQINYFTTVRSTITPRKADGDVDTKAFVRLSYEKTHLKLLKYTVKSKTGEGMMSMEKTFTSAESRRYSELNPIIREDIYDNPIFFNGSDRALYFRDFVSNIDGQCIIGGKDVTPTFNTPEQRLKKTKMKSSS
jgi:hypothetical protein